MSRQNPLLGMQRGLQSAARVANCRCVTDCCIGYTLWRMDEFGLDDYRQEFDDRHWRCGIFYVNRDNPNVFVSKRYGVGFTLNLGNSWSWAVLALILIAVVVPLSIPIVVLKLIKLRYAGR